MLSSTVFDSLLIRTQELVKKSECTTTERYELYCIAKYVDKHFESQTDSYILRLILSLIHNKIF